MAEQRIEFMNVGVTLGDKKVFEDFSWEIPTVKPVVLAGASGVGKTTLLRLLAGLIEPDVGEIVNLPPRVSYLFQEPRLIPSRTVLRNLLLVSRDARRFLKAVGLEESENLLPAQLSGGMRQRAAIARAFAFPAPLLLLDEPFKELDAETSGAVLALLEKEIESREQVIIVTHDKDYICRLGGVNANLAGMPAQVN